MYRSAFFLILLGAFCARTALLPAQDGRETVRDTPPRSSTSDLPSMGGGGGERPEILAGEAPVRLERLEQDAIILIDPKTGRPQIGLPNSWTPELVDAIGQYLLRDQQNMEPVFTIHEIDAKGTVAGGKVKVDFRIQLTCRDEPVVRIPLGLKEGVLLLSGSTGTKNGELDPRETDADDSQRDVRDTSKVTGQHTLEDVSDSIADGITEYNGEGAAELIVDPAGEGYVVLIRIPEKFSVSPASSDQGMQKTPLSGGAESEKRGRRDLRHTVGLTLWFPLFSVGEEESKLAISFPAAVRSRFSLIVPLPDAVATTYQGTLPNTILPTANGETEFDLRGLKSNFEIVWRQRKSLRPVEDHTVLSVEGATILARVSEDRIDYEAILPIRARGSSGLLDSFRVKLPPGVQIVQEQLSESPSVPYTVTRITPVPIAVPRDPGEDEEETRKRESKEKNVKQEAKTDAAPDKERKEERERTDKTPIPSQSEGTLRARTILSTDDALDTDGNRGTEIEVKMLDRIPGVFNFPLRATKSLSPDALGEQTDEIIGFEVVGADKQSGVLSVELPSSDRRLTWRVLRGIERAESPEVAVAKPNETRFVFHSQPFRLQIQVRQPRTRINVRPEYVVFVEKDRVRMNVKLSYAVYGSRTEMLRIRLAGWEKPEVEPFTLVDVARIQQEGDLLLIPLQSSQEGSFELELKLSRPIPPLSTDRKVPLRFELPVPEADSVGSATLAVVPVDCIQLFPRDPLFPVLAASQPVPSATDALPPGRGASENSTQDISDSNTSVSSAPKDAGQVGSSPVNGTGAKEGDDAKDAGERISGLARTSRRSLSLSFPNVQQAPLIYQGDAAGSLFVADMLYRRQQVAISSNTEIRLLDPVDQIRQTLDYTISYERMDDLYLYVPRILDGTRRWKIYLDGQFDSPLETRTVPIAPEERIGPDYVKKRISLGRIGNCSVNIVATLDRVDIARDFSAQATIPFVLPAEPGLWVPGDQKSTGADTAATSGPDGKPGDAADIPGADSQGDFPPPEYEQTVGFSVRTGIDISLNEQATSGWVQEKTPLVPLGNSRIHRFRSRRPEESIKILVSQEDRDAIETTIVDRAWIQSWLSDTVRADYFTFQFSSVRDGILVYVPTDVGKGRIAVRLDGERVAAQLLNPGEVYIPLDTERQGETRTLELWYKLPRDPRTPSSELELPHFDEGVMVRCVYWQLILPQTRHLFSVPAGWTPEYQWGWTGLFLGRFPALKQEDLGLRIGSSSLIPVSGETNSYLLSSLRPQERAKLLLVNRGTLVLVGSGLALVVGLLLIYVPQTRYVGSLFALGTILLATLLYRPGPMLLVLQASIIGILLALIAFYLDRLFRRQNTWKPAPERTSSFVAAPLDDQPKNSSAVYSVIVDETEEKTGGSRN